MEKQKINIFFFIGCFLIGPAVASSAQNISDSELSDSHNTEKFKVVISKLADYRNFRIKISELDRLLLDFCTKELNYKTEMISFAKYKCDARSGIDSVEIDSQEDATYNYVMALGVFFRHEYFDIAKKIMTKKLGPPSKTEKNYIDWDYVTDREMSKRGNPTIFLVTHSGDAHSSFNIQIMRDE